MKLYDRYLIVRRALIIACKPSTEAVMMGYKAKDSGLTLHNIYTDYEIGKETYLKYWKNLFLKTSSSSDKLKDKLINFNKLVQDDWNKSNMGDPLRLIKTETKEFKSSAKDRLSIKNMFNDNQMTIPRLVKILLSNKYQAFVELHPDDTYYIDKINLLIEEFMSKIDSVFYTTNQLESDRDFAIMINHQPFAYVLWLARKSGNMVDHVFNNMPLYYRVKMIHRYIELKLENIKS